MAEEAKPVGQPAKAAPPAFMQSVTWDGELAGRLKERFGSRISECSSYLEQNFVVAEPAAVFEIADFLKESGFDYLVDVTAVDYPKKDLRFELVYIFHSFALNERIRVKTAVADGFQPRSLVAIYPTANWLEREVYDMFGIEFEAHPDMRRILLPDEWQGFPLRKDKSILAMDNEWVKANLGIESGQ
jgi:NADH-quinone oxidoreductase subunit C